MRKAIILGIAITLGVLSLAASFLLIISKITRMEETIKARDGDLRAQLDEDSQILDQLKQGMLLLGQDTNLFRGYLQLPPRALPTFGDQEEKESPPPTNEHYFSAVQTLLTRRNAEEAMAAFANFLASKEVSALLSRHALTIQNHYELEAEFWKQGEGLYHSLSAIPGKDFFTALSRTGQEGTILTAEELSDYLEKNNPQIISFYRHLDTLKKEMGSMEKNGELQSLLKARGLTLSEPIQTEGKTIRQITGANDETLLIVGLEEGEAVWTLQEEKFPNREALYSATIAALENLDLRSPEEILVQEGREEIEALHQDNGFLAYLEIEELSLATLPREDHYFYYYDLLHGEKVRTGSFAIQKNTGELYLMDKNDVSVTSIKTLHIRRELAEKKNAPSLLK